MELEVTALDRVIKNAVHVVEESKYEMYEICESARQERQSLNRELEEVAEQAKRTIEEVDRLERSYRQSRLRLSEVSKNFQKFKESDIRSAYETASNFQSLLTLNREKEKHLKERRDDLQKRLKNIDKTIERAEGLVSQMGVVLQFLSSDLSQIPKMLENAKHKQVFGFRIILAQEEERKRIAREIHDGLAQSLANVVLRTEITERMLIKEQYGMVKEDLADLKLQLRQGLAEVRKIIFNLRPMALDDLGLIPTLLKFTQDYEERNKIRTDFKTSGKECRLAPALEVAIYRLVQEAFSNVLKHAKASIVSLLIEFQTDIIKIIVKDNGVGFQMAELEVKMDKGNHVGLIGMRERVEIIEGTIEFESEKNKGTTVTMFIPIQNEA